MVRGNHSFRALVDRTLSFAGDRACQLCLGASSGSMVCGTCAASLPRLASGCCPRCALPVAGEQPCRRCDADPPRFARTVAAFEYRYPVDRIIQALKYGRRLPLAAWCAGELQGALAAADHHWARGLALVPMPATARRIAERGFDHATEIARVLAATLGVDCLHGWCRRVGEQAPQASLPWRARAGNVAGAFRCPKLSSRRPLAIVDDVMTTGASASELAATLFEAGATEVEVWVVARTPPPADRR